MSGARDAADRRARSRSQAGRGRGPLRGRDSWPGVGGAARHAIALHHNRQPTIPRNRFRSAPSAATGPWRERDRNHGETRVSGPGAPTHAPGRKRSCTGAQIGPHPDDRYVAIGVVRSESTQIVKAVAREPSGAAGLRLLRQRNATAARGCFSGQSRHIPDQVEAARLFSAAGLAAAGCLRSAGG
jgi:hypothetical protein